VSPAPVHQVRSVAQAEQITDRHRPDERQKRVTTFAEPVEQRTVAFTVNNRPVQLTVPVRRTLADALRDDLGLTGTHLGCEHGVCGACTVLVDGRPVRSCLLFAVTVHGSSVTTVEGCTEPDGSLGPVQQAFWDCHGLQCGFCTAYLEENPTPTEDEAREAIAGNLCRCTGYQNIVASVLRAAELRGESARA